jgi:hypothetical protein
MKRNSCNHTLATLVRQREKLEERIAELRAQLLQEAIAQCRTLIAEHGLTEADLFKKRKHK